MEKPLFLIFPKLAQRYKEKFDFPKAYPSTSGLLDKDVLGRHIGIEIEVEECGMAQLLGGPGMGKWIIERDPSLRGEDAHEFKTSFPCTCAEGIDALAAWFGMVAKARKDGAGIFSFSERTSIHIHVDIRDLTLSQIKAAVKLYMIFEKSFFDFVGRHRFHNIFCVPLLESEIVNSPLKATWWRKWEKYCAINLATLEQYGTIEFRAMAGNDNQTLITHWLLTLVKLIDYASKHTLQEVEAEINELKMESQYRIMANNIFGAELAQHLVIFPEVSDMAASLSKQL